MFHKLLLFSLIFLGLFGLTQTTHAWYNASWTNRIKITFSGATTSESLAGYPVTVLLNSSRINYANASSSGSTNIRFVDPDDQTLLPYEVGYWNSSGTSTLFVKTNHASSTQTDFVYMYYNNPSATSTASSTAVWDSNYLGVWHMSDAGTGVVKDSTANLNDGKEDGAVATTTNWGKGEYFNGSVSTTFAKFPDNVTSSFSAMTWMNNTQSSAAAVILGNEDWISDLNGFLLPLGSGGVYFYAEMGSASGFKNSGNVGSGANNGQWHNIQLTWQYTDSGNANFYADGVNYPFSVSGFAPILNVYKFKIGANAGPGAAYHFIGAVGETRISKIQRSAGWVKADRDNGLDTYNTYGNAETNNTAPTISSFTAAPSSITSGSTSSLAWTITGATYVSIDHGIGSVATSSGSTNVAPTGTTSYTLSATNGSATTTATTTVTVTAPSDWWNASWQNRIKITFSGATTTENLANFPVLVSLNSSRITYANASSSGSTNIRFIDPDKSTLLPYEIDNWNSAGTTTIWVKANHVSSTQSDYIYMYYNNPTATSTASSTAVWDSNFKAVYHLATTASTTDSTSNVYNFTSTAYPTPSSTGKIDGAESFNGSTNFLTATKPTAITSSTPWTVSMWAKYDKAWDTSTLVGMWHMGDASGQYGICYWYNYTGFSLTGLLCRAGSNTSNTTAPAIDIKDNNWHHWVFTWDGNSSHQMKIYKDGVDVTGGQPSSLSNWNNNAFEIGNGLNESYHSQMSADETRISNIIRSDGWIYDEYYTGADLMNTYGSQESQGAGGGTPTLAKLILNAIQMIINKAQITL